MTTKLEKLERQMIAWAESAARGDEAAEKHLGQALAQVAAARSKDGWPTPGSVAHASLDALVEASKAKHPALRRLAPAFLDTLGAHPDSLGIPYGFRPARQLGDLGIPLLAKLLERALGRTSRATIEGFGKGNPSNSGGFKVATDALVRLFEYEKSAAKVAAALVALPWSDERLWLLFRMLAGGYGGPFARPDQLGPVAASALPALIQSTAGIQGDGARRLRAVLLRGKVISKEQAGGVKAAKLPRALPTDVASALSLIETFGLSPEDVEAGPPAKPREIVSLEKKLGERLPAELHALLSAHRSIGDREIGPPSRMKELLADLAGTIAEHEEEADEPPSGAGEHDIRAFEGLVPLGTDDCGDLYLLATRARSSAGAAPVIRFHHDEALVATVAADSLGEYVAIVVARVYARREGLEPKLERIEDRKRKIAVGASRPRRH
jgi:cell wall assembly regulator SMI1